MKRGWRPWDEDDPPPTEASGELERIPRAAGTGTAMQQLHLRLTLEREAAEGLRKVLERDGKRVVAYPSREQLRASFCVDVSALDLQRYTGSLCVCSCEAFDRE
jgi:hypothetical protein